MHCKRHIGRRRKKRMRHAFVCVACGMLHKGLHANPLSRITLGLWFGGRLPADLRLGGFGLACRSLELRPHGLPGLRLLICMEYVSMSIQQSPDRAAHKGRHACESIELHQFGALVRRPSPRGAEGLETWAWRAGAWLGDLGAAYRTRPGFGEHGVCAA